MLTKNVLEFLEKSGEAFPKKIAVNDGKTEYTYDELMCICRRVGSALAPLIKGSVPAAVLMEKSADTLCAFFGVVYAGGIYSLLDPKLPKARLKQMGKVLQADVIITDEAHHDLAKELFPDQTVLMIASLKAAPLRLDLLEDIREQMIDTDPLYVNFTSGSTGCPKGVLISHSSVIDFIESFTDLFQITAEDIIGNQAPFDFDVSVKDIYAAMKTGATLVLIPKELFSQPKELIDFLCEKQITTLIWAVSALCLISVFHGFDYRIPKGIRKVLFSGETMPLKHLQNWREHLPEALFVNLYGPTEITCNCTYHILEKERSYDQGIPIGDPFPNKRVFLLTEDHRVICNTMEIGEICVAGSGLALGYCRNDSQTAAVFTANPANALWPQRIYHTGDLGSYNEEGKLVFHGRKDFQIKYQGHRLELEEIEAAFTAIPGIENCCCVFDDNRKKLYGFYLGNMEKKVLYRRLRETLPVYMIPGALRQTTAFPLTKNGKIDRKYFLERIEKPR